MAKGIRYTPEQKAAYVAEYNTSGMSLSAFCMQQGKPSYVVMSKWVKETTGAVVRQVGNAVGKDSGLFADFTKSLLPDDVQTKYIAFLEKRVRELEAKVTGLSE